MLIDLKYLPVVLLLLVGSCLSVYTKKLTVSAALAGSVCGLLIYAGSGYPGLFMIGAFFLSGTLATALGRSTKDKLDRPGDSTQRKYGQVLANSGTAAIMGLLMLIFPLWSPVLLVMLVSSLASATGDTLSSELGMLYGRRFYNCITWKSDERGLDGVVSLEGTLIGVGGAALIAAIFAIGYGFDVRFFLIIISGTAGNLSDSVFGATLERRNLLNNDWVNFFSTLFAAGVAILFGLIFKQF